MKPLLPLIDPIVTLVDYAPTEKELEIMKQFRERVQKIISENKNEFILLNRKN